MEESTKTMLEKVQDVLMERLSYASQKTHSGEMMQVADMLLRIENMKIEMKRFDLYEVNGGCRDSMPCPSRY